jgi:squalene-associated FAD-dependent desaturase
VNNIAKPDVIVVGAGWAGLAAATELARHGLKPLVLESARQIGGRARSVRLDGLVVDNGQHVLLGSYRSVLQLLGTLGIEQRKVLRRMPLTLLLRSALDAEIELRTRALPAPLHLLWALMGARGLSVSARVSALRLLLRARLDRFDVRPDIALTYYLRSSYQSAEITRTLWQPLCRAALGSSIERASTRLFLHVLRDFFFGRRMHSDLLMPIVPLLDCVPQPAMDYIETHGGSVRVGARASALHVGADGAVSGVQVRKQTLSARHVILATPPANAAALLQEHAGCEKLAMQLGQIEMNPICTLYLEFPPDVTLPREFIAVLDGTVHWLFDRGRLTGRDGLIAAVVGGAGAHNHLSDDALTALIVEDIARLFPSWPAPKATHLLRETDATFAATPQNEVLRPRTATPIKRLWLAGDYVNTGYPGILEGAVRSGILCARRVLRDEQRAQSGMDGTDAA